jgi:hypothetical protein
MASVEVDEACVVAFAVVLQRAVREEYEESMGAEVVHSAVDDSNLLAEWDEATPWVRQHFIGISRRLAVLHNNGVIAAAVAVFCVGVGA